MELERREVLKFLAAAPFAGLLGWDATVIDGVRKKRGENEPDPTWRVFEPPFLSEVAFPLGGIGTGTVSVGGRGNLRDWEICNRANKGRLLDNTFFCLWFKEDALAPKAFILESKVQPPYPGGFGLNRAELPGMPRFSNARFLGSYPFARLELSDPRVPLDVALECFNPFIPGNERDSGLPAAIFYWQLKNTGRNPVSLTVVASLQNIAGIDSFGQNENEYKDEGVFRGLMMRTRKHPENSPKFGNMALVTTHDAVTYNPCWDRGGWFDAQSLFWNDLLDDGQLTPSAQAGPSPDGQTDTGSLGALATLDPGQSATIPFLITWYFPNRENYWNQEKEVHGKIVGNYYATQFGDAWDVARHTLANLRRLEEETRVFHEALYASTLPPEVLDAVSSQASIIRTNTCFRTQDGKFYGFEGNTDTGGCCPLNCTHVYNYEQSLAFLFPALERTMRDTDFLINTDETGKMAFRTLIPLGQARWGFPHAAADGQMGCIIKLYREWQISGDILFLQKLWPHAKRALEFAWRDWDPDRDGIMTGQQHNTYDIEFYGANPMMGVIYLTALRAAEEMARALQDHAAAEEYRRVYESGRVKLDQICWNGEYYIQIYDPATYQKYQLGDGCLSDQMLGQWMAHVTGLGYMLPEDRVKSAIHAVYKNNFRPTLTDHYNPQRIFALGDEAGLLLCSWPRGNRPPLPFVYSDEVWTGIEYQVAAHLIYEGFVNEGLTLVRAVRNRYDGQRRNPWNEVECGHHYARAMASWSVFLALTGFNYSGPQKMIAFNPRINEREFTCFWSCDGCWGLYTQQMRSRDLNAEIHALFGKTSLQKFSLPAPSGGRKKGYIEAEINAGANNYSVAAQRANTLAIVTLPEAVNLESGQTIQLRLRV